MKTLQKGWGENLSEIFQNADKELVISSPYISDVGAKFLIKNINVEFQKKGVLKFVTDLSPKNIYQGSTDPNSFKLLFDALNSIQIFHLPRLHAKVYVSDEKKAIITSGNLTAGGIYNNFEYGVFLDDIQTISKIKNDLVSYGNLGALINYEEINSYCSISEEVKQLFRQRENSSKKEIEAKFKQAVEKADSELIKAKIGSGAIHTVFEKTILYILKKNMALPTTDINILISEIHPDLCDNEVDRVINGVHFGKKWKHAVRTTLQNGKKKGIFELINGNWQLCRSNEAV